MVFLSILSVLGRLWMERAFEKSGVFEVVKITFTSMSHHNSKSKKKKKTLQKVLSELVISPSHNRG